MQLREEYHENCEETSGTGRLATLPDHPLEDILARLPLHSLAFSSCVCKRWRSLTSSPIFFALYSQKQEQSESWLYVNGFRYIITDANADSEFQSANRSSFSSIFDSSTLNCSWGAGGLCYLFSGAPTQQKLQLKLGFLDKQWVETPELKYSRSLPIIGVVKNSRNGTYKVICAGGLPSDGSKESTSSVEVFDSQSSTWELCEALPAEFHGFSTSRSITAVVCNRRMYFFHIYSGIVASFHVESKQWSDVKHLRPPGTQYCYLAARNGGLFLVGVSYENDRFAFKGWKVDESSMECSGPSRAVQCHFTGLKSSPKSSRNEEVSCTSAGSLDLSTASLSAQPWACQYFVSIAKCLPKSTLSAGIKLFDSLLGLSRLSGKS